MKCVKKQIERRSTGKFASLFSTDKVKKSGKARHDKQGSKSGKKSRDMKDGSKMAVMHQEAMATAEYAIVTLAAVGLAGLLIFILKSEEVRNMLMDIILKALSSFSPL